MICCPLDTGMKNKMYYNYTLASHTVHYWFTCISSLDQKNIFVPRILLSKLWSERANFFSFILTFFRITLISDVSQAFLANIRVSEIIT